MSSICRVCQCPLIRGDNWALSFEKYGQYICTPCETVRKRKYRPLKPPKEKQTQKEYNLKERIRNYSIKEDIIKQYGGGCLLCGCSIWQFLTIDHINNNGAAQRKIINKKGIAFYKWLKKQGYPKDNLRLLCFNCNSSRGNHGFCSSELSHTKECEFCRQTLHNNNSFYFKNNIELNVCNLCMILKSARKSVTALSCKKSTKINALTYKIKVITNYGGKCSCCGNDDMLSLTIDHINNDGVQDREEHSVGVGFYRFLIKNNYPKDNYQLLCYNCNCCKGAYGQCYHTLCKEQNKEIITIDEYKDIILSKTIK